MIYCCVPHNCYTTKLTYIDSVNNHLTFPLQKKILIDSAKILQLIPDRVDVSAIQQLELQ